MAARRAARKRADPREVEPVAYVVDSGGQPVRHWWTKNLGGPKRSQRRVYTTVGIYRQTTSTPDDEEGRHTVWLSDEDHGDSYPWGKDDPRPARLTQFMAEARTGKLSGTFALTAWGREAATAHCKCLGGGPLEETERVGSSKRDWRGGLSSKQWKKQQRRAARRGGG